MEAVKLSFYHHDYGVLLNDIEGTEKQLTQDEISYTYAIEYGNYNYTAIFKLNGHKTTSTTRDCSYPQPTL